jgi:hypothetical protein
MAADVASVQFSRTVERLITPAALTYVGRASMACPRGFRRAPVSQNSTAWLASLRPKSLLRPSREGLELDGHPVRFGRHARPGLLGHPLATRALKGRFEPEDRWTHLAKSPWTGALLCAP